VVDRRSRRCDLLSLLLPQIFQTLQRDLLELLNQLLEFHPQLRQQGDAADDGRRDVLPASDTSSAPVQADEREEARRRAFKNLARVRSEVPAPVRASRRPSQGSASCKVYDDWF
jgi:hypothetical protein